MKKLFSVFSVVFAVSTALSGQVDRVLVRQQWPWNADVRIEYVVSGLSAPAAVSFKFFEGDAEIPVSDAKAIKGDSAYAQNGINIATFSPKELFGSLSAPQYTAFSVKVVLGNEDASMGDKLYRIVDLDTGKVDDLVRADFYNGKYGTFETSYTAIKSDFSTTLTDVFIWTGVTNNPAYRESKMVLRKINAANVEWLMGTNNPPGGVSLPATPHLVKLTKDYYIGVFPVTQLQYAKLNDSMGSKFIDDETYPGHGWFPVYGIAYNMWRGVTPHWTVNGSDVAENSYLDKLRKKCGGRILFDLATEAQWEFACRGGNYETVLYSGKAYGQNSLKELGWCLDNSFIVSDGPTQPHPVGLKYPNAYGLYDMLGNMLEWCLDFSNGGDYGWKSKTEPEIDPQGVPFSEITLDKWGNGQHIVRGGAYNRTRTHMTVCYRDENIGSSTGNAGARICCPAE